MRAIIFKELRENARWAMSILLALGALMAMASYSGASAGLSLVGNMFSIVTDLGFPAVGFVLGLLVVLQDYRPGRWSFLTHRPISRSRIFLAKLICGLAMYFLVTALPLAVATLWFSTPGKAQGPFLWSMIIPRLADLLGGIVGFAAGMLVASRRARWVGSRLAPAFAVLLPLAAMSSVSTFPWAMLCLASGLAVLLPVAWAAFTRGGDYQSQPVIFRFLQGIVVSLGIVTFGIIVVGLCATLYEIGFHQTPEYSSYVMRDDGQIAKMRYPGGQASEAEYYDLQGHRLDRGQSFAFASHMLSSNLIYMMATPRGYHDSEHYLQFVGSYAGANYFYVVSRNTIEGYSQYGMVGSIGPNGFEQKATPTPFLEPLSFGPGLIATSQVVYQINWAQESLTSIFTAPDGETIPSLPQVAVPLYVQQGPNPTIPYAPTSIMGYAIVTNSAVHVDKLVVPSSYQDIARIPLDDNASHYQYLGVAELTGGRFAIHYQEPTAEVDTHAPERFVIADAHGQTVSQIDLPQLSTDDDIASMWLAMVIAPAPVALSIRLFNSSTHILPLGVCIAVILVMAAFWAGLMPFIYRRWLGTRGTRLAWTVVGALAGIVIVPLLPSLREKFATPRCPSCGKPRPVTQDQCPHCGAPFSMPSEEGIEVFEMA